jgi:hypothetical protein
MANALLSPPLDRIVNVHWADKEGIAGDWIVHASAEGGTYDGSVICSPTTIVIAGAAIGQYTSFYSYSLPILVGVTTGFVPNGRPIITPEAQVFEPWEVVGLFTEVPEYDPRLLIVPSRVMGLRTINGYGCYGTTLGALGVKGMDVGDANEEIFSGTVDCSGIRGTVNGVPVHPVSTFVVGGFRISVTFERD